METTQPRNITTADAPFNDPTDSVDLVIRTADNVDFFVLSVLLSLKSPSSFFRSVLANRHTEERDGLPVLDVKEDSETFRIVLQLCYPSTPPQIKSVEQLVAVGKTLDKYCMDHAMQRFLQISNAPSLIREQPLRVFAHAVANGWKELGEAAAKLYTPLDSELELEDLRCLDALQYVRLRDYHRRCDVAAQAILSAISRSGVMRIHWLEGRTSELLFLRRGASCWCRGGLDQDLIIGSQRFGAHSWVRDYFAAVAASLPGRPCPEIALDEDIIGQAVAKSISQCGHVEWTKIAGSQIHRFATLVAEVIDTSISQVPLNIDCAK
ncbi:hypothetical protein EDD18DRAFT_1348441 [Armillaria luteobubalina]|uniref:BTB domain-containing protein n=1 Tax=Armillaria luteobubalina TaxID=153913 RepID=A0AA39V0V0_9AGAR|nr:hypothetical protein EDD18DRAFT_1348441 [Armillaria luteobubalina]